MKKRSNWKLPFIHSLFFKKKNVQKKSLIFRIRNSNIPANFVNKRIKVYNGTWFLSQDVMSNMIGFKLGQFSYTRRSDALIHSKVKRRKKKSVKKKR